MAALLGQINAYDPAVEEWPQYVERLEQYFEANGIMGGDNAAKRRSVFISVMGPAPYKLLRSLLAPVKPADKTFEELAEVLTRHYSPTLSEVMQRFRFNTRSRKSGESVADYIADLRRLAEFCEFGTTLEKMLRDRLVCGINDSTIQKKLLAEQDLTYQKAKSIALGSETAEQNLKEMRAPAGNANVTQFKREPVNQVNQGDPADQAVTCHRCGTSGHLATQCRFKDRICHKCGKKGHLAKVCRSKSKKSSPSSGPPKRGRQDKDKGKKPPARPVHRTAEETTESEEDFVYQVSTTKRGAGSLPPLRVSVGVDDCLITMEVDTGASLSIMAETTFNRLWPKRGLDSSNVKLQSYSKDPIPVVGSTQTKVSYEGQVHDLPLIIVAGDGPTLLGRNWLQKVRLNWSKIHYTPSTGLQGLLEKYDDVFQPGLGTFKGYEAKIHVDPSATPRFFKARTVPYSMRGKVAEELDRLVSEGVLEPIEHSDWAAPIIPVLKSDRQSVRICGGFNVTVNPVSKLDKYPIPRIEDIFATLKKGKTFTKIDLSQAYLQVPLDSASKKYVVINTRKGLYRYTRLPYGISSAPGIFQRIMENLLQDIPGVVVYIDDILVTGETEEDHLKALEEVLSRLSKSGLKAKKSKCKFMASSVSYLGYVIDAKGLHPLPDKVRAIEDAPTPQDVAELKSYLGLLTYYGKFLPNLSTHLAPLYRLLGNKVSWHWGTAQKKAFRKSKDLLTSSQLLIHFDADLPLTLACDASAYGIGTVLAHKLPDGSEKPIGYASRTLNSAERNYSQLEKEGLACVFGVKRFYSYLFGHTFQLITDHKPLLSLLGEHKPTSPQASARIRRWSLYMCMFEYTMTFRNTSAHSNADALSRLPLPEEPASEATPPELVLLAEHLSESPVTADQIKAWTRKDPELAPIVQFLQQGWPSSISKDDKLTSFFTKRNELSLFGGCVLWGTRVVVPAQGREAVLTELHEGHPGIASMKGLSRMYVWWPGISADIEQAVRGCKECQLNQASPAAAPLNPWGWPTRPWARLHLDYAGPVQGRMILILIDAHSKWIEAFHTTTATSAAVIEELRTTFARFGLPETIVTDNGSCFVSAEFESFLQGNGIKHFTSAPYHPASNGLAERAVQIVKNGLKKVTDKSIRTRLAKVLMAYRLTPQSTTGVSSAEMLLGKRPRSRLDLLKPHIAERVESQQLKQKQQHDSKAKERKLEVGDPVLVRNYQHGDRWIPGTIRRKTGPVSFLVEMLDGSMRRCHQDQVRKRFLDMDHSPEPELPSVSNHPPADDILPTPTTPTDSPVESQPTVSAPDVQEATPVADPPTTVTEREASPKPPTPQVKVYPKRDRKPRVHFEPTW